MLFESVDTVCQSNSRRIVFWTPNKNTQVKLTNVCSAPDQSCSNAIKTNGFVIQGSKNNVQITVLATLAGGHTNNDIKTQNFRMFCDPRLKQVTNTCVFLILLISCAKTEQKHMRFGKQLSTSCFLDRMLTKTQVARFRDVAA